MIAFLIAAALTTAVSDTTGRGLYQAACANCHAADGKGAPISHVAFDTPLPDFTDCSFATREADADWSTIVHGGGPVRGFSRLMPAFRDALDEAETLAVLQYIRTLCTEPAWPRGELNMPRALLTEKAYPEDESVVSTAITRGGEGSIISDIIYERRLGSRAQIELIIPVGSQKRGGDWSNGLLGDVILGLKQTLFHSLARGAIASIAGEISLPTGDGTNGIGAGTTIFESFLAVDKLIGETGFVQTQAGLELPLDQDKAASEMFARGALGMTFTQGRYGRAWTPIVEVAAARELEGGAALEWDVAPQMQISLNQRQHLLFNAGVRIPLTQRSERKPVLMFYFLWDWFDGGLRDGW